MEQTNFYHLLSDLSFEEVLQAYYTCRKNKRNSKSALKFEIDYERNLIHLWQDIIHKKYDVLPSLTFLVEQPVVREIFAADFRDRIVHHLIISKINHLFEEFFSDFSYNCRVGKGSLKASREVYSMIRQCSKNYTESCYILKLDIMGYFFHIDKAILKKKLHDFINNRYYSSNKSSILYLIDKILENNPIYNCIKIPSKKLDGKLPQSKSLFYSRKNCGMPIGNLTSQIFANFYLTEFDHFVKSISPDLHYARYVDDMVFIHPDRDFLVDVKNKVKKYLSQNLHLTIHPKKNGVKSL